MATLRAAWRQLRHRPGFTLVAIGTLAMAIGANTAVFSLVEAVPGLPFAEPDALIQVRGYDADDDEVGNLSPADFLDFARETRAFVRMGAFGCVGSFTVAGPAGDAERVGGVNVTEGLFPTLGVSAALGRVFSPADDEPDAPATVV